jgi:hypothetical protein
VGPRVAAAVSLIVLALAAPAQAAEIAFVSGRSIWASQADGSGRRLLLAPQQGFQLSEPAWSPDGTRLAYVNERQTEDAQAQLMVFDGVSAQPLTPLRKAGADASPAWSPDGSAIAFLRIAAAGESFRTSIMVRQLATGAERTLITEKLDIRLHSVGEPAWSPHGALVAYTDSRLDKRAYFHPEVRVVAAGGGPSHRLVDAAQSAAWSPDGRRLAYSGVRDKRGTRCGSDECAYAGELYVAAADGSGPVRLTRGEGDETRPAWSPDGSRILFTSDRNLPDGDSAEVYSVAADGSCLTWLTNGTPASALATWRPGPGPYDPGGCDPATRAPTLTATPPRPFSGALWLGFRYAGLLYTRAQADQRVRYFTYDDCERFDPRACPSPATLTSEPACRAFSFRGLTDNAYRYLRVHGALLAYYDRRAAGRLLSGAAVTSVSLRDGNPLPALRRVIASLRPIGAAAPPRRLLPPQIPRALARRLERTAAAVRRAGVPGAARSLHTELADVRGALRLRAALRAFGHYRIAAC